MFAINTYNPFDLSVHLAFTTDECTYDALWARAQTEPPNRSFVPDGSKVGHLTRRRSVHSLMAFLGVVYQISA